MTVCLICSCGVREGEDERESDFINSRGKRSEEAEENESSENLDMAAPGALRLSCSSEVRRGEMY